MAQTRFSRPEALRFGWEITLKNLWLFVGILVVMWLVGGFPDIADKIAHISETSKPFFVFLSLGCAIIGYIMQLGFMKILLQLHDGKGAQLSGLFSCPQLFFKFIGASILYGLIVMGGILLLIVPGIIWAIRFGYYAYAIVDKDAGPIESLKISSAITQGAKWDLFVFGIVCLAIGILGAFALFVGLFVAIPTISLAAVFVYRKLLNTTDLSTIQK